MSGATLIAVAFGYPRLSTIRRGLAQMELTARAHVQLNRRVARSRKTRPPDWSRSIENLGREARKFLVKGERRLRRPERVAMAIVARHTAGSASSKGHALPCKACAVAFAIQKIMGAVAETEHRETWLRLAKKSSSVRGALCDLVDEFREQLAGLDEVGDANKVSGSHGEELHILGPSYHPILKALATGLHDISAGLATQLNVFETTLHDTIGTPELAARMHKSNPHPHTLSVVTRTLSHAGYSAREIADLIDDGGSATRRVHRVHDRLRKPRAPVGS